MNQNQLYEAIAVHRRWIHSEPKGKRMVLDGKDLRGLSLRAIDETTGADLTGAILRNCDLRNCKAASTIFNECDLTGSAFQWADLTNTVHKRTNLTDCDLRHSILHGARIHESDLTRCNFGGANCHAVLFSLCNHADALFEGSCLWECDLFETAPWRKNLLNRP